MVIECLVTLRSFVFKVICVHRKMSPQQVWLLETLLTRCAYPELGAFVISLDIFYPKEIWIHSMDIKL